MFDFLLPLSKKIISLIFPLSVHGAIALYLFKLKIQNLYLLKVPTFGHSFVIYVQVHINRILYIYRMHQFQRYVLNPSTDFTSHQPNRSCHHYLFSKNNKELLTDFHFLVL